MTDGCASDYMRRWGLSCRRPVRRARKQDTERVEKWKREEYLAIVQQAEEEEVEIYWGDETGISTCENCERGRGGFGEDSRPGGRPGHAGGVRQRPRCLFLRDP